MINKNRNLAQKWRAKTFAQIVGQPLCVRMLQNSLYANRIFPVYLFSGQRGCGKTSTARIFAAALNCANLDAFRQDPKTNTIPCLTCDSCIAMSKQEHPDFIEMDAASHTGVDNIRDIIDAASLVPVLGRMRIYLLDEAHMLSKAAFNAFLKILEEPPMSVVFILATTDLQKIIDTVRSRCFNVFFNPVQQPLLVDHLAAVCTQEGIQADQEGLTRIAYDSQGCVRDALTLVEQVWYAHRTITKQTVAQTVGAVNDEHMVSLFDALCKADIQALCAAISQLGSHYDPLPVADGLITMLRAGLWHQLQIPMDYLLYEDERFMGTIRSTPQGRLIELLQAWCDGEVALIKATNKRLLFETLLLRLCKTSVQSPSVTPSPAAVEQKITTVPAMEKAPEAVQPAAPVAPALTEQEQLWQQFIALIQSQGDNLLFSMFKQGRCLSIDQEAGEIDMVLPDSLLLFKDMIDKHKPLWSNCLNQVFGKEIALTIIFDAHTPVVPVEPKVAEPKQQAPAGSTNNHTMAKKNIYTTPRQKNVPLDVSDREKWQKTSLVLEFFPGTVTKVGESS